MKELHACGSPPMLLDHPASTHRCLESPIRVVSLVEPLPLIACLDQESRLSTAPTRVRSECQCWAAFEQWKESVKERAAFEQWKESVNELGYTSRAGNNHALRIKPARILVADSNERMAAITRGGEVASIHFFLDMAQVCSTMAYCGAHWPTRKTT